MPVYPSTRYTMPHQSLFLVHLRNFDAPSVLVAAVSIEEADLIVTMRLGSVLCTEPVTADTLTTSFESGTPITFLHNNGEAF